MQVLDFVWVKNVISKQICEDILSVIKNKEWSKHEWYSPVTKERTSEETKELDIQPTDEALQQILTPSIIEAGGEYNQKFALKKQFKLIPIMYWHTII